MLRLLGGRLAFGPANFRFRVGMPFFSRRLSTVVSIIHIRTRHVSFSILIGRNSVAEWLIVASTYHLNSDPK